MCGIVGVINLTGITLNEQKFFKQGLYADALRGRHSTGVFALTNKLRGQVFKRAVNASDFLQMSGADQITAKYGTKIMMLGHNRHATVGDLIDDNAHPFSAGHITMVHNGSLTTQWRLDDSAQFDVDSEVIAHNLAKNGPDWTIPKLDGSFSLVWYDSRAKTVNFIRNSERPMYLASLNKSSLLFASEPEMIEWLASRNYLKPSDIISTKAGVLTTLDMTKKELDISSREIELFKYGSRSGWQGNMYYSQHNKGTATPPAKKEKKEKLLSEMDANERLKTVGLATDEEVEFVMCDFKKTASRSGSDLGMVTGFIDDVKSPATNVDVEAYAVHDMYDLGALYRGLVVGSRTEKTGDKEYVVAIINPKTIHKLGNTPWSDKEETPKEKKDSCPAFNDDEIAEAQLIVGGETLRLPHHKEPDDKEEQTEEETGTFLLGPRGEYIPLAEWQKLSRHGCANCQCDLSETDHALHTWLSSTTVLCADCAEEMEQACGCTYH